MASTVFEGTKISTFARIINVSEKEKKLSKGQVLAEAEVVDLQEANERPNCQQIAPVRTARPTLHPRKEARPRRWDQLADDLPAERSACRLSVLKPPDGSAEQQKNPARVPKHIECVCDSFRETLKGEEAESAEIFLIENADVFSSSQYDLGRTDLVKHCINTGAQRPIKQQLRRHPIAHLPIIDEAVEEMLSHDLIEPTSSPWASNVVLVRKKDNSLRFCIDYRHLNNVTVKDSYPLPRIDTCFDALGGAKYFSTLDLRQGFFQVAMDEESQEKTAFVTRRGVYKFKVLAFGLSNSPAVFQRLMDLVLAGLTWEICLAFLDDIIVMSKDFNQHLERLGQVFDRLRKANLKLKAEKCHLFKRRVKFLGSVVSEAGVEPDPEKVRAVKEWPRPQTLKDLRAFVALASYYRRHILHFAEIARPLHDLTKKNQPFVWDLPQQKAFEDLKARLTSAPILALPESEGEYILDTDACDQALGAVLQQRQGGEIKVIAYASRVLQPAEQSYCTTRKELSAIIFGLKQFRHYLLITPFLLRTDHAALTSLLKSPEPVGQQARWLDLLAEHNFRIEHRAGRSQGNADGLSRRPCGSRKCTRTDCILVECDGSTTHQLYQKAELESDIRVGQLKHKWPNNAHGRLCSSIPYQPPPDPTLYVEDLCAHHLQRINSMNDQVTGLKLSNETLRNEQNKDPVLLTVKHLLQENTSFDQCVDEHGLGVVLLWSQAASLTIENDILYRKFERPDGVMKYLQAVTPKSLRVEFLKWTHSDFSSGHFGIQRTQAKLQQHAYWPGWRKDTADFVRRCETCCRRRQGGKTKQGPLQYAPGLSVWQKVHIDLTGPHVRSSNGYTYLLTAVCSFSKYLVAVPLRDKSAMSVAKALVKHCVLVYGASEFIVHDLGREFVNEIMNNLALLTGTGNLKTTSYRASSNGAVERVHSTINNVFAKTVSSNMKDWDIQASYVCFAYNTSRHSSTTFDPFFLQFGRQARVGIDMLLDRNDPAYINYDEYTDEVRDRMQLAFDTVQLQLKAKFIESKRRYDRRVKCLKFTPGDFVWYFCPRLAPGLSRKWRCRSDGPFLVVRKLNNVNYAIQKSVGRKPFIVHVDRLRKYEGLVPASLQRLADETMKAGASTVWNGTDEAESGRRRLAEEQESEHEVRRADAIKPCLRTEEMASYPPSQFEPRPTVPQTGRTEEESSTGSCHASAGRPADTEPETDSAPKPNQAADPCLRPIEPPADRPKTTGPLMAATRNPTPASREDRMPAVINLRPPRRIRRPARFQ